MLSFFKKKPLKYINVDVQEFTQLMKKANHVVLDVRSPEELAEGEVPGNRMINFFDGNFKPEIEKLDTSKTYLVYCRSGNRSGKACAFMAQKGFEKLYNLQGGIGAWNAAKRVAS